MSYRKGLEQLRIQWDATEELTAAEEGDRRGNVRAGYSGGVKPYTPKRSSGGGFMSGVSRNLGEPEEEEEEERYAGDEAYNQVRAGNEALMANAVSEGDVVPEHSMPEGTKLKASSLDNDPAFQKQLSTMQAKWPGLTKAKLYNTINGESGFNPKAYNKSGASGLFQFMPATAKGLGYTTSEIMGKDPAGQLKVYDEYLTANGYNGGELGIMQAAPAFANASPDTEVYRRGTAAHKQNPGWRGSDGRITVRSINAYYHKG